MDFENIVRLLNSTKGSFEVRDLEYKGRPVGIVVCFHEPHLPAWAHKTRQRSRYNQSLELPG